LPIIHFDVVRALALAMFRPITHKEIRTIKLLLHNGNIWCLVELGFRLGFANVAIELIYAYIHFIGYGGQPWWRAVLFSFVLCLANNGPRYFTYADILVQHGTLHQPVYVCIVTIGT